MHNRTYMVFDRKLCRSAAVLISSPYVTSMALGNFFWKTQYKRKHLYTYTYIHLYEYTYARTSYFYEHIQKTEQADQILKFTKSHRSFAIDGNIVFH
jgi:hypothetical protein